MRMKIIVNCASTEFLDACLQSIRAQTISDWEALVTLDGCSDEDLETGLKAVAGDRRVRVVRNVCRQYSLPNQIQAIERSGNDLEDVIVSLDGDDWFSRRDALSRIAHAYRDGAWMTYGSWHSPLSSTWGEGCWPAYLAGLTDFRNHRWLATAVRTWKRWLWDMIEDSSLRDDTGEYFRIAEDRAIMYPLLEMSGTERAHHIAEPIMFYNQDSVYSASASSEADRNVSMLKGRPPYALVEQPRRIAQYLARKRRASGSIYV